MWSFIRLHGSQHIMKVLLMQRIVANQLFVLDTERFRRPLPFQCLTECMYHGEPPQYGVQVGGQGVTSAKAL